MNVHIEVRSAYTIESSDGLRRRAFSASDVRRMVEAGIMEEGEPFELIEGELIFMNAQGFTHDWLKTALARKLGRLLSEEFFVGAEVSLQLADRSIVQPDLLVGWKREVVQTSEGFLRIPADRIFLLIEVAVTTLSLDLGRKASLYAGQGVAEYWVVDANERTTWVHREPAAGGYASVVRVRGEALLRAAAPDLTEFSVRLADLD